MNCILNQNDEKQLTKEIDFYKGKSFKEIIIEEIQKPLFLNKEKFLEKISLSFDNNDQKSFRNVQVK